MATWGAYGARGRGVTVGVLDTSVDATHPDLDGKVDAWAEFDLVGQKVVGNGSKGFRKKIKDLDLLERAKSRSSESLIIFIEVDLPARQIEYTEGVRSGKHIPVPVRVKGPTRDEQKEIERRTEETRVFLEELLGGEPRWLKSSRSVVVTATGEQLSAIADFRWTKAIHPNRELV